MSNSSSTPSSPAPLDRSSWKRVRLGEICSIKARIGWQGLTTSEYLDSGEYCLVSGTDFENGFVNWKSCSFVSEWRYKQDPNIQLRNGDVLISKDGTIGKVAYVWGMKHPTTLNSGVFVIRPKTSDLLPSYLQLIFRSQIFTDFLAQITAGSTIVHLYQKDIVSFSFPLPPLPVQRRIASSLSAVDGHLASLGELVSKYEAIKKSTVSLLLRPQPTWQKVRLGDVAKVFRGGSPRPIQDYITSDANGINWIKIGDVATDAKYIEHTEEKIKPSGIAMSRQVKAGDFILSNSMSFGRPYILKIDGCIHDGWLTIQDYQATFEADYLYYLLGSEYVFAQYLEHAAGSSVKNLNKEAVGNLSLPVPPLSEQRRIVTALSSLDGVLSSLAAEREKLVSLKRGLLRHFFG